MSAGAIAHRSAVGRRLGAEGFLAVYLALLFVLPARLIVPGMGAGSSPASLFGLVALGWWVAATMIPGQREFVGRNPVRTALYCYLMVVLLTWTLGKMRPLTPLESTTSDRSLLMILGLAGIALVAMDGIRTRHDVERLVWWMLNCAMVMVLVGTVQFLYNRDLSTALRLPGLVVNSEASLINTRSIFNRPHGTTLHPIEYGVVAGALVPLAYWFARRRRTVGSCVPLVGLVFAAMTSISRSAVLALAVAGVVLLIGSSWRQRAALLVGFVLIVVVSGFLVDGLVGTLQSLFRSAGDDPSVQARVDRFPQVIELVAEYPLFGRGYGTYTPEDYFLLDNELQKTAIESGLVGVAVLVLFIGFVAMMAWRTRFGGEVDCLLGTALAAAILGIFVSSYTFDAFFYRILTGVLFLCIGLVGAMYRLTAADRAQADGLDVASAVEPVGEGGGVTTPAMSS